VRSDTPDQTTAALERIVRDRIDESIAVKQALHQQSALCTQIAEHLIAAYRNGKKAIWFGNGGSAADAQHIVAEFVGRFYLERRALPALALNVNASILTCIGNDYGFEQVFARQIEALGQPGDVAIGISTSGNSINVLEGIRMARGKGLMTVGLTGERGGQLAAEADFCLCVPSTDTPRIQETHILVGHIWSELVEQALCGDGEA